MLSLYSVKGSSIAKQQWKMGNQFLLILILFMVCVMVEKISAVEITCDKISGTQHGIKFCFIRHLRGELYSLVKVKADSYAEDRREVVFDNCTFHMLPEGLFVTFPKLTTIYMWNTGVRNIPWQSFINANNLVALDLSHNNITTLNAENRGVFSLAKNLRRLHLDHNDISEISGLAFEGLLQLTHLYLDCNNIVVISAITLAPLKSLNILHLNENRIERIGKNFLQYNNKLFSIHLHENNITRFETLLDHLRCVQDFTLQNNSIEDLNHIDINAININIRNTSSRGLHIGNRTAVINAADNHIQYVIVATGNTQLLRLDLSNNNLTELKNLTHLNKLVFLDLSNRMLTP